MKTTKALEKFISDLDNQALDSEMQYIFKNVIFDAGGSDNKNFLVSLNYQNFIEVYLRKSHGFLCLSTTPFAHKSA